MNFFDHKDLGNHLLQLCPKVVKHPVYEMRTILLSPYKLGTLTLMRAAQHSIAQRVLHSSAAAVTECTKWRRSVSPHEWNLTPAKHAFEITRSLRLRLEIYLL